MLSSSALKLHIPSTLLAGTQNSLRLRSLGITTASTGCGHVFCLRLNDQIFGLLSTLEVALYAVTPSSSWSSSWWCPSSSPSSSSYWAPAWADAGTQRPDSRPICWSWPERSMPSLLVRRWDRVRVRWDRLDLIAELDSTQLVRESSQSWMMLESDSQHCEGT